MNAGHRILIVSGGYGLLVADEPIGTYKKVFSMSDWPDGLLTECILDYAGRENIHSVIAMMSASTDYAKLIRRVNWKRAGLAAVLVSPICHGGGAQTKVPRAQGQALTALVERGLRRDWRSSDSLDVDFTEL
jgi:hypothetical protein